MQYSRSFAFLAFALFLFAVSTNGQDNYSNESQNRDTNLLKNPGAEPRSIDVIDGWFPAHVPAKGLRMWRDTETSKTGEGSFAIENTHEYDHPVCNNWAQTIENVPAGSRLRLIAYVKTDNAKSAGVCVQCISDDPKAGFLEFAATPTIRGTNNWNLYQSKSFVVPPKTTKIIVRASLCGTGSVRFDDIRLDKTESDQDTDNSTKDVPKLINEAHHKQFESQLKGKIVHTLSLKKDCMVLSYIPNWDHGQVDNIAIASYKGGVRVLIRWEDVPESVVANSKHRFFVALYARDNKGPGASKNGDLNVYEILEDWPERSSFKNQPKYSSKVAATVTLTNDKAWKFIDVTEFVHGQAKDKRPNNGVVLRLADENVPPKDSFHLGFPSREAIGEWQDLRPALLVVNPNE